MGCNDKNKTCTKDYDDSQKIALQHGNLSEIEFLQYFENKVFKTIRKYKLFPRDEKIAVAASGGKDSTAALYLTKRYFEKYKIPLDNLFAIVIDEGIKRHRNESLKNLKKFCKDENIKLIIINVKENFKTNIDESAEKIREVGRKPCMVCGIWRRYLLNKYARENGANKLVTGHNLDDEAQAILMNQFKANISLTASLGPISGKKEHKMFVRRVKPLYFCSNEEVILYTKIKGWELDYCDCIYSQEGYRSQIKKMLNEFEDKYPGTKHGIIKSFLEILPLLKEKANDTDEKLQLCELCGEPANNEVCNACKLQKELLN